MRHRLTCFGLVLGFASPAFAQPTAQIPTAPQTLPPLKTAPVPVVPLEPRPFPAGVGPSPTVPAQPAVGPGPQQLAPTPPPQDGLPLPDPTVVLPQKETLSRIDPNALTVRRSLDRWQVVAGFQVVRDFGSTQADAEEFVRTLRELRASEWGVIGTGRTVVEYGLTKEYDRGGGATVKASSPAFSPKTAVSIDPATVRVESVRGVWVLRDADNILLNFGKQRDDAEQAFAVLRRYGFNRLAQIGPATGGATVLFAQDARGATKKQQAHPLAELNRHYQENQLTRTGIEVAAGNGAVGERIVIDPKACEIRRDKGCWVLAHGTEVLANFGMSEWSARDALKLVQEQRYTEFCRFNSDVTFFLVNGQPPTRVPFAVSAVRFDKDTLKVRGATNGKFGVYEGLGRLLFTCDSEKEAEQLVKVLTHYGFDTACQMGLSARTSLKFLAKTGR
jgi:hypothetical protein